MISEIVISITVLIAIISWFLGNRYGRKKSKVAIQKASEKAEKERKALDEEINADPDLVARAHASGVVRKS